MTYVIAEPCIDRMDQTCVEVCPVDCITTDLNANGAIFRADALPAEWASFAWIDATWYRDPATARAEVDLYAPAGVAAR